MAKIINFDTFCYRRELKATVVGSDARSDIALLKVEEIYEYDKKTIAEQVYKTVDKEHPGVSNLYKSKKYLLCK